MKKRMITLLFLFASFFSLSGCWDTGKMTEETIMVDLKGAREVVALIVNYQGDIEIAGTTQMPLLISEFSYNLAQWSPQITYMTEEGKGNLKIIQKENEKGLFDPVTNHWSFLFNQKIPLELDVMMGNGENDLDLSNINLTGLKAVMGTGDSVIDLTGDYDENIAAYLVGGIGHTTIYLRPDIGIRILIKGGLNQIHCDGFNRIGNFYYNSVFDFSEKKIYITLLSGLGMIDIKMNPSL